MNARAVILRPLIFFVVLTASCAFAATPHGAAAIASATEFEPRVASSSWRTSRVGSTIVLRPSGAMPASDPAGRDNSIDKPAIGSIKGYDDIASFAWGILFLPAPL